MLSEVAACTPIAVDKKAFNSKAKLPYGLKTDHVREAMMDFVNFLGFVNAQLNTKAIQGSVPVTWGD